MEEQDDAITSGISENFASRKDEHEAFYDRISRQLEAEPFGDLSHFLNLGYASDGSADRSNCILPKSWVNKNSARLVLELLGDYPINGKRVLDVGCGRGGTITVLQRFFDPAALTGLDLSGEAIAFDRRVHGACGARFIHGHAEKLPFDDGDFDVVINVESSHSYPDVCRFYSEVRRVLTPEGIFLYTDLFATSRWPELVDFLETLGFECWYSRNITKNVMRSCQEIAAARAGAFSQANKPDVMADFLAVPGSSVYTGMEQGHLEFRIFNFTRSLKAC